MSWVRKNALLIVLFFTVIGALIHFYNLTWGAPYYFHPDERNVAYAITRLSFPESMNPGFFAYGSLPIYTVYLTGITFNSLKQTPPDQLMQVPFEQAIILMRTYSAVFATLLIPLIYILGKRLFSIEAGLLASFFTLTSVGITQFSHFGTFELWLTFFSTVLLFISLEITKQPTILKFFLAAVVIGVLIATKVTSLALAPLPVIAIALTLPYRQLIKQPKKTLSSLGKIFALTVLLCCVTGLVYIATNPYSLTDYKSFEGSMRYESDVALGNLPVFYTQEFYKAPPIIFQLIRVYPFLINPLLTLLMLPAIIYIALEIVHTKSKQKLILLLITAILFFSQAFLFVKWTRYMVPTLPFVYLIIAFTVATLTKHVKKIKAVYIFSSVSLIGLCLLYCIAYIMVVLIPQDTRITAKNWAKIYIAKDTPAVSESYDLGILPFNDVFNHIALCNNYDMEINSTPCDGQAIDTKLTENSVIILPSQRIYKTRFTNPMRYPKGALFYRSLFSGKLGYRKVYETPCNVLCRILYLGNPVYSLEQTATVFDRPTITIFEKN